ncbi:MAG: hypothetical protein WBY53_00035 [Acidobacteriaceae bacterium]
MLKSLGRRFAGTALLFSGIVGFGTSVVLLVSSCFGYLPYSDRPGPGWWGRVHWPSWAEAGNYLGFAPWFAYFCLFFGLGLFGLCLVLGVASTPRWLNRIVGGVIAAAAAGLAVMSAGWYLALAAIGPDAAVVLGLTYGVFLFPRFVESRVPPITKWIRISAASCATVLFVYWIASPFLPHEPLAPINYDLVRVTPGEKAVTSTSLVGSQVAGDLAALNLRGDIHGGIGGAGGGSGQNAPAIDMELIALEPITKETKLAIPKTGYVLYVLKHGVWTAYPSITRKDKRSLIVEPGTDARYDGGRVKVSGEAGDFQAFTWYPVILKGR